MRACYQGELVGSWGALRSLGRFCHDFCTTKFFAGTFEFTGYSAASPSDQFCLTDICVPLMGRVRAGTTRYNRSPMLKVLFMTGYISKVAAVRLDLGSHEAVTLTSARDKSIRDCCRAAGGGSLLCRPLGDRAAG